MALKKITEKNDILLFWRVANVVGCTARRVERWMNGTVFSFMSYAVARLQLGTLFFPVSWGFCLRIGKRKILLRDLSASKLKVFFSFLLLQKCLSKWRLLIFFYLLSYKLRHLAVLLIQF